MTNLRFMIDRVCIMHGQNATANQRFQVMKKEKETRSMG